MLSADGSELLMTVGLGISQGYYENNSVLQAIEAGRDAE